MIKQENVTQTWTTYMQSGNFDAAWKVSEEVLKAGLNRDYNCIPRHFQNIWDGTPLNGKRVLIRCYHGLGDTIQFIRYAKLVKEIAREVIVWAQPELIKLLETVKTIDKIIPLHDGAPDTQFDVDVEIMELPFIFRTNLKTLPRKIPYLYVDPLPISNDKFSIGLIWQGGNWDISRDVPFSTLIQLFDLKKFSFYILQSNAISAGWIEGYGINPGNMDLYNFSRFEKSLNLLITIDSMPAHLAGALNVPVWLMLPKNADWRWLEHRSDSPWYPSMRLFRQSSLGEWNDVVKSIKEALIQTTCI